MTGSQDSLSETRGQDARGTTERTRTRAGTMGEEQSQAVGHRALRHVAFCDELETRLSGAGVPEDDGGALVQGHLARSTRLGLDREGACIERRLICRGGGS